MIHSFNLAYLLTETEYTEFLLRRSLDRSGKNFCRRRLSRWYTRDSHRLWVYDSHILVTDYLCLLSKPIKSNQVYFRQHGP